MSFIPWIEDDNVNATQDYNTYLNDSQRKEGFKGGTPASAIRVNTALRQANLVVTALMKALNVSETLNYRSLVEDVQNAINTTLTTKIVGTKVNNAKQADNAANANNANTIANVDLSNTDTAVFGNNVVPKRTLLFYDEEGVTEIPLSASLIGKKLEFCIIEDYTSFNPQLTKYYYYTTKIRSLGTVGIIHYKIFVNDTVGSSHNYAESISIDINFVDNKIQIRKQLASQTSKTTTLSVGDYKLQSIYGYIE